MASHDPVIRRQVASIGGLTRWAFEDPSAQAERAKRNIEERFLREVDPDGVLEPDERARRATRLKSAYFKRLALKSAQARRRASTSDEAA